MGASAIALCGRCRREVLPVVKGPSWHRDVHRAPAKHMAAAPDARAERIKARKERKSLRTVTREEGFMAVAKQFLLTTGAAAPISEECADCIALQKPRARFLGYDSKSNRAFAQSIASA